MFGRKSLSASFVLAALRLTSGDMLEPQEAFTDDVANMGEGASGDAGAFAKEETCTAEQFDLVRKFIEALGERNFDALNELFADGAQVVEYGHGEVEPADLYASFLPRLVAASTTEEAIFCQTDSESPAVAARFTFRFSFSPTDERVRLYLPEFQFIEEDGELKFGRVEIFKNAFLKPDTGDLPREPEPETEACSEAQRDVVRAYVDALTNKDADSMADLFEEDGILALPKTGSSNAREAFGTMLPHLASSRVEELGLFCQVVGDSASPSLLLRLRHTFTLEDSDEEVSGVFLDQFTFGESNLLVKVEAFANVHIE
jgi:ketosteroid isomerase-like protein